MFLYQFLIIIQGKNRSGDFSIDFGGAESNEESGLQGAVGGGGVVYQQQLELMEEQDAYLQSRADTMKTIETTIVELGQMFTQLATMVKEQEEIVHRYDLLKFYICYVLEIRYKFVAALLLLIIISNITTTTTD